MGFDNYMMVVDQTGAVGRALEFPSSATRRGMGPVLNCLGFVEELLTEKEIQLRRLQRSEVANNSGFWIVGRRGGMGGV